MLKSTLAPGIAFPNEVLLGLSSVERERIKSAQLADSKKAFSVEKDGNAFSLVRGELTLGWFTTENSARQKAEMITAFEERNGVVFTRSSSRLALENV